MGVLDYLSTLVYGTSTGGAAGAAETTSTLGQDPLDARQPPDLYRVSNLQIAQLTRLLRLITADLKGGTRFATRVQSASPIGAGEFGFWVDNATTSNARFSGNGAALYLAAIAATTKGDLAVWDGNNWAKLAAGSNTQVLTADSTQTTGVKWAAAANGSAWVATAVADTSPTIAPTNAAPAIARYTSISAARIVTGTTAGAATTPALIGIVDESGSASATNTISFTPSSGTIDGQATKVVIAVAKGQWFGYCDGTNWHSLPSSSVLNSANAFSSFLVSAATANRVWTLPDATDTAVGKATTDTLTNKTLTAPVINGATSASGNFDLSGSSGTTKTTTGATTLGGSSTTLSTAPAALAAGAQSALATFTWTDLSLSSGWTNQAGYANLGWTKDAAGIVHLRGYVTSNGSGGTTIATLPAGARPGSKCFFVVYDSTTTNGITINTDGTIVSVSAVSGREILGAPIHFPAEG